MKKKGLIVGLILLLLLLAAGGFLLFKKQQTNQRFQAMIERLMSGDIAALTDGLVTAEESQNAEEMPAEDGGKEQFLAELKSEYGELAEDNAKGETKTDSAESTQAEDHSGENVPAGDMGPIYAALMKKTSVTGKLPGLFPKYPVQVTVTVDGPDLKAMTEELLPAYQDGAALREELIEHLESGDFVRRERQIILTVEQAEDGSLSPKPNADFLDALYGDLISTCLDLFEQYKQELGMGEVTP